MKEFICEYYDQEYRKEKFAEFLKNNPYPTLEQTFIASMAYGIERVIIEEASDDIG